jgi:uncharacterized SAM-binding protein YcdF (DUF218 family)
VNRALKRPVLLFCGGWLAFALGFLWFAAVVMSYGPNAPAAGDAVVVLTGGELRVREGLRLFAAGAGRRILISGVHRSTSKDDLRRQAGVTPILFDCCVDVGHVALDTVGNAAETRAWLQTWGFRRLVVVTSNYHMPRSLMELGRALPGIELVPHVVVSRHYQPGEWWRHPGAIKLVATEYLKFLSASGKWVLARARAMPKQKQLEPDTPMLPERPDSGVSSNSAALQHGL